MTIAPSVTTPGAPGVVTWALVRRHPVAVFLLWFFTVGQAIALVPVATNHWLGTDLASEPFLLGATYVGLLLPVLVITALTEGAAGVRALLRRVAPRGVSPIWYAGVTIGVPLVMVAVWLAVSGQPQQPDGSSLVLSHLLNLLVVLVTFNLWEEIAWTGFVQARLQSRHGAMVAATLTAPAFALGHISQVLEGSASTVLALVALLVVVCVPLRALMGWLYNRTGSVLLVGLGHAAANATAAGSLVGPGLLDRLYPGDGAGGLVFPILGVMGLVAIAMTRGRLGQGGQTAQAWVRGIHRR